MKQIRIRKEYEKIIEEIKQKESEGRKVKLTDSQIVHLALDEFYVNNYKESEEKKEDNIF